MSTDSDYLAHAFPVLVTYTQQVGLAVDIDRLCRIAAQTDADAPRYQFLNALRDFAHDIREIEGLQP